MMRIGCDLVPDFVTHWLGCEADTFKHRWTAMPMRIAMAEVRIDRR